MFLEHWASKPTTIVHKPRILLGISVADRLEDVGPTLLTLNNDQGVMADHPPALIQRWQEPRAARVGSNIEPMSLRRNHRGT